ERKSARARSRCRSQFALRQARCAERAACCKSEGLAHDPDPEGRVSAKWTPVFPRDKRGTRLRGDHAQTRSLSLDRQRLDKWLWQARVVTARPSAAGLVEGGHVRINGVRETAPGHAVKAGDVLTIGLDRSVRVLKITGFSERRGDAASARVLYVDLQELK